MSVKVTVTLDDEIGAYLKRLAADQGRTPAEMAAWIVTEDLRREQAIDADLLSRLDDVMSNGGEPLARPHVSRGEATQRERAGA